MGLLDAAKKYNSMGWSVIPIRVADKRPAISTWEEYQKRLATPEEIEEWFKDENLNIALITGEISGIDVVDVDSYKGKSGVEINSPIKVLSPRGGTHFYFKHTQGVRPGVNADIGVDLRGDGSYVLIPPSKGTNGKQYTWDKKGEIKDLPQIPKDIVEKIKKTSISGSYNLEDSLEVTQGSRNDALHRASVSLISKHGEAMAWKLILGINKTYTPPLPEREVNILFKSAAAFVRNNPPTGSATQTPPNGWTEPTIKEDLDRVKKILREGQPTGYPSGFPELDNITGGLLPGQSYLVFGDTNTGKSLFTLNILVYLARNDIKCLYFDLENSMVMSTERQLLITEEGRLTKSSWVEILKEKKADEFIDRLINYPLRIYDINKMYDRFGKIDFDSVEVVMNEALKSGVQVIAIDHIHYFEPSEQDFNKLADISRRINDFCSKHGVVVIMVAHTKKGLIKVKEDVVKADRPTLDHVSGAGMITRNTKNIIALRRNYNSLDKNEQRKMDVFVDKTKNGPTGWFTVDFEPSTLIFNGGSYTYNPMKVMKNVQEIMELSIDNVDEIM